MSKPGTGQGVMNFLNVAGRAVLRPTRILTGAMAIGAAVALPTIAVPALIGGGIAVLAMSWADINDPDFISKVLRPAAKANNDYTQRLNKLITQLKAKQKQGNYPEVTTDIEATTESLEKIAQIVNSMPQTDQGSVSFVIDQLEKLTERLMQLMQKEQIARSFLANTDVAATEQELQSLEQSLSHINDAVAKKQIKKAAQQKQAQLNNIAQVEQRLSRIDAYIANIRAVLYTTYSDLARLQLRDEYLPVDDADVLSESLKQIVDEIDAMDSNILDIASVGETGETKKVKQTVKIN